MSKNMPMAGENDPETIAPNSKAPSGERPLVSIGDESEQISSSRFETDDADAHDDGPSPELIDGEPIEELQNERLQAQITKATIIPESIGVDRFPCQACGSSAYAFGHPQGFHACGRCGTLQQPASTLRADYAARVEALGHGEELTITGPFRGQRGLDALRARMLDGTYLLERAGAILLMLSFGMALKEADNNRSLTFIKE